VHTLEGTAPHGSGQLPITWRHLVVQVALRRRREVHPRFPLQLHPTRSTALHDASIITRFQLALRSASTRPVLWSREAE
jgi:hypothetical protein